jgi:hypothetical protein
MKKIILAMSLLSFATIAFAEEVRVFNEKTYTTGGAKDGGFIRIIRDNANIENEASKKVPVSASVSTHDVNGKKKNL